MLFTQYLGRVFRIVLVFTLIILFARTFLIEPSRINGRSMESTYLDNDFFLVDKLSLLFRGPRRGEVVQLVDPESKEIIIKRVIGLPGESLSIRENKVFILKKDKSEFELKEPYLDQYTRTKGIEGFAFYEPLAEYEYFLMGDHREESRDSRIFGPVHRSYITGRAIKLPF